MANETCVSVCLCGRERRPRAFLRWSCPESPWPLQEWVSKRHAALFKQSLSNTKFSLCSLPLVSNPAHHHAEAGKIQVHAEDYISARTDPSDAGGRVVSRAESNWGVLSWSGLHCSSAALGKKTHSLFFSVSSQFGLHGACSLLPVSSAMVKTKV